MCEMYNKYLNLLKFKLPFLSPGPSKADINCKDNEDGTLAISYKPTEPGFYILNLKFADNLVMDSPYIVKVCQPSFETNRYLVW